MDWKRARRPIYVLHVSNPGREQKEATEATIATATVIGRTKEFALSGQRLVCVHCAGNYCEVNIVLCSTCSLISAWYSYWLHVMATFCAGLFWRGNAHRVSWHIINICI